MSSSSVGKVTVGTGSCFLSMGFSFSQALTPVQQTFGFPPRRIAEPRCHIHFFIVLQLPLWFLSPSFAACRVCDVVLCKGVFFGTWPECCGDTPGSHDLLPFLQSYCLLTAPDRKTVQQGHRECVLI